MDKIIHADVFDGLKQIPDESVHLVFSSPPYNVNINYNNCNDDLKWKDYIDWMYQVWKECSRTLVVGGRLAINIDAVTNRQEDSDKEYIRPVYYYFVDMMKKIPDMNFRTEICWYKQNSVGKKTAWGSHMLCSNPIIRRTQEYILVWSKKQWMLPGDHELSDMTKQEFEKYTLSTWYISPETKNLGNHPVPFPVELCKRMIKLFTYRENVVLDPFCGSGTTCYTTRLLHRHYIGIDNDEPYVKYARDRVNRLDQDMFDDFVPRSQRIEENKRNKEKIAKMDLF